MASLWTCYSDENENSLLLWEEDVFPKILCKKSLWRVIRKIPATRCVLSALKRRIDTEDYNRYHTRTCVGCSGCSTPRFHRILPARGFQDEMRGFGDTMRGFGDTASRVLVTSFVGRGPAGALFPLQRSDTQSETALAPRPRERSWPKRQGTIGKKTISHRRPPRTIRAASDGTAIVVVDGSLFLYNWEPKDRVSFSSYIHMLATITK